MSTPWPRAISKDHQAALKASAISPDVAKERGYRTVEHSKRADLLGMGFKGQQVAAPRFPGLLIPMYRPGATEPSSAQFRPDNPRLRNKRPIKYDTPVGSANMLDVHPRWAEAIKDPTRQMWIVEGVKKADALTSLGEIAVAIPGVWSWRGKNDLGGKTALAGWDDIALDGREVYVCFDSDVMDKPQVKSAMERLVDFLRHRGAKAVYVVPEADGDEKVGADDYLASGKSLESLKNLAAITLPVPQTLMMVDIVDEVADKLALDHIFVPTWRKWLVWTGKHWTEDPGALLVTEKVLNELKALTKRLTGKTQAQMRARCHASFAAEVVSNLEIISGLFHVHHDEIDAHPHLLNVQNGVVDLRTGTLLPHESSYRMMRIAKGSYKPGSWTMDVARVTEQLVRPDVVNWLQRLFGYACFGTVTQELFPVLEGGGENGKTTLLEAIGTALGDYAAPVPSKLMTKAGTSEHATIEADLFGLRVAWASETEESAVLSVERVKSLTGGDSRKARRMREDYWSFEPSHTLFLATNHYPIVPAGDWGTWRRMRLIEFPYRFTKYPITENEREGDKNLRFRLKSEQLNIDAMLSWLIDGALKYQAIGLDDTPESVERATLEWRREEDSMGSFVDTWVDFGPTSHPLLLSVLAQKFAEFTDAKTTWNPKTVARQFVDTVVQRNKRVMKVRTAHGYAFHGVQLRATARMGEAESEAEAAPVARRVHEVPDLPESVRRLLTSGNAEES